MRKNLGGWQRLWVVTAIVYLIGVGWVTWSSWPASASITHKQAYYSQLTPEAQTRILNAKVREEDEDAFIHDAQSVKNAELVEMPNGHVLVFRKSLPRGEAEAFAREYWTVVEHAAYKRRLVNVARAFAWWFIPLALIYVGGLAVRWVFRGFKES
ncbi:hypothetical protein [Thiohalomonas denitrificans]|uniref:hypothetical protein n=1 Tax=Thiohalomonas denitrificans TaxID=415747 RepID=UPI0026ED3645|nr:hypothetical protein [Thiohalomonas denitrificans]